MTNRVDRLERSGLVERRPDPGDRRGVLVRLTTAGRDVVDSAMADLIEQEKSLLSEAVGDRPRTGSPGCCGACWLRSRRARRVATRTAEALTRSPVRLLELQPVADGVSGVEAA